MLNPKTVHLELKQQSERLNLIKVRRKSVTSQSDARWETPAAKHMAVAGDSYTSPTGSQTFSKQWFILKLAIVHRYFSLYIKNKRDNKACFLENHNMPTNNK